MKARPFLMLLVIVPLGTYLMVRDRQGSSSADASNDAEQQHRLLAPEFSVADLNGRKLDLADYRGKVVLLDFWATWCAPCRSEIPRFIDLQNEYRDRGLQMLGISLDDQVAPVRAFYEQFKINYPVAIGDARLAERYGGILGLPVNFVIDCDGRIVARYSSGTEVTTIERQVTSLLRQPSCAKN
jgi:peroxiredoxin